MASPEESLYNDENLELHPDMLGLRARKARRSLLTVSMAAIVISLLNLSLEHLTFMGIKLDPKGASLVSPEIIGIVIVVYFMIVFSIELAAHQRNSKYQGKVRWTNIMIKDIFTRDHSPSQAAANHESYRNASKDMANYASAQAGRFLHQLNRAVNYWLPYALALFAIILLLRAVL